MDTRVFPAFLREIDPLGR